MPLPSPLLAPVGARGVTSPAPGVSLGMGKPTAVGTGPSKGPTGGAQGPHPPADAEVLQIAYDLLHRDVEEAIERLEDVVSDLRWAAFRGETDSDQLYRLVERFEDIAGRLQEGLEVADGTLTAEDDDC